MMPPEGPNKAEELLQRYAKERRERAGDFSLHPATRGLLQGEVTRQLGKARAAKPSWVEGFNWRRRGFAFGGGIAAVVLVGVSIVVGTRHSAKRQEFARAISPRAEKELFLARAEQLAEAKEEAVPRPVDLLAKNDASIGGYLTDSKERKTIANAAIADAAVSAKPQSPGAGIVLFGDVSSNVAATNTFAYALSLAPAQNVPVAPAAQAARSDTKLQLLDGPQNTTDSFAPAVAADNESGQLASFGVALANSSQVANRLSALSDESRLGKQAAAPAQSQATYAETAPVPALNAPQSASTPASAARGNVTQFGNALGGATVAQEKLARIDSAGVAGVPQAASGAVQLRYYRLGVGPEEKQIAQRSLASGALAKKVESSDSTGGILTNFTVESAGGTMRLHDADGSVYEGTMAPMADVRLQSESETRSERDKDNVIRETLEAAKTKPATAPVEVSFTVSGSNITSRQLVIVRGRFTAAPATNGASAARFAARRPQEPAPPFGRQSGASNATENAPAMIDGILRVGASGEQPFHAMPIQR